MEDWQGLEARAGESGLKKKEICVTFALRSAYKQYELYIRLSGCIIKNIQAHLFLHTLVSDAAQGGTSSYVKDTSLKMVKPNNL